MPIILDKMARRYNRLPTDLLDMDWYDFQINYLCMEAFEHEEDRYNKIEKAKADNKARLNRGKRF